jgi:hypothetical protein
MRLALIGLTVVSLVGCRPVSQAALIPAVLFGMLAEEEPSTEVLPVTVTNAVPVARPVRCDPSTGVGCPQAPTVTCPSAFRFAAGSSTTLRAAATGQDVRVRWSVARSPGQHGFRFATSFESRETDRVVAEGGEVPFTAVIVGDYTVRAQAVDAVGRTAQCESTVTAISHGLRVELSWNTDRTDVDLHMLSGRDARWFSPSDCYYGARQPDQSLTNHAQRRWLDTDDVNGFGPENIRVDAPDPAHTYRIGVHFYSAHEQRERTTPTVLVYCGETLRGRYTRPMSGSRGSMENDFWEVASVRFDGNGGCSLEEVHRVSRASDASNHAARVVPSRDVPTIDPVQTARVSDPSCVGAACDGRQTVAPSAIDTTID